MSDHIGGDRYFRCETYRATISVAACRHYRGLAEKSMVQLGFFIRTMGAHLHIRCKNCQRAELLEDGWLETWPLEQMLTARENSAMLERVGGED